ncbi:diguanylate cyclase [Candidatus Dehalogenimonas loeffleri]|uniref:Diguanylate cyclase n=1 Tax=Candidatus Dehalogenimonas loeffleri TaxID=3127115 RepID=A0ABZ2J482_9CHLR
MLPSLDRKISRAMAYFAGIAALWGFSSFMLHLDAPASQTLLWNKILIITLVWTLVAYYHFVRVYVFNKAGIGVLAGYLGLAIVAILSLNGHIVTSASVLEGVVHQTMTANVYLVTLIVLTITLLSASALWHKFRSTQNVDERLTPIVLLTGMLIAVTAGFTNLSDNPMIYGLPIDQLASFINLSLIVFVIFRHRLVPLRNINTQRGFTYALLTPLALFSFGGLASITMGLSGNTPQILGLNAWAIIPLVASIVYVVLLLLVLQDTERKANRFFAYFLSVAAFWSFTSFMLVFNPAAAPEQLQFWNEMVVVAITWIGVAYYHFVRVYVNKPGGIWVYIGYAFTFTILILALNGMVVSNVSLVNGYILHDIRPWDIVIGSIIAPFVIAGVYMLLRRYRQSIDPVDRNRTVYLLLGSAALIILSYITPFTPALAGLTTDHIGNIINTALIAYAISRFHLLDIKLVARRGLTFLILVTALAATYAGMLFLTLQLFPGIPQTTVMIITGIIVTLLALTARPLTHFIAVTVDRIFYRENYVHRQELLNFSNKMSYILNLEELSQAILPPLAQALNISHAALLFQNNPAADFTVQYIYPENHELRNSFRMPADNPIVEWMDRKGRAISPAQVHSMAEFKGLWQSEKEQLANADLALIHPIKSRDKLVGIIATGNKNNGGVYSTEDLELINRISSQAGVIIENAQLFIQANTRANTDELTGLYNHRHFHERVEQEISRGGRFGITFSLILLDLDLFKVYNDIYGHLAGDQLLRKVGQMIHTSVRNIDLPFRYGGEEFAIILPETRIDDAYRVAERLRKTIEARSSFREMPVTASLGVSNWPGDGLMKEEVIHRADLALYRAKRLGRNRTCLASETAGPEAPDLNAEPEAQPQALSIIYALAATVDAKDHYTYGHSRKVSEYAVALAEAVKLPEETVHFIRAAGLLHDIGKIGVPDSILTKPSALDLKEWEPIRTHPELGVEILKHVVDLSKCLPAILHHHEHWDGSGYPHKLKGESIPLEARILTVADAYDAITSPRPYRDQLSLDEALTELRRCSGSQFDPQLVEVFCRIMQPSEEERAGAERRAETKTTTTED